MRERERERERQACFCYSFVFYELYFIIVNLQAVRWDIMVLDANSGVHHLALPKIIHVT